MSNIIAEFYKYSQPSRCNPMQHLMINNFVFSTLNVMEAKNLTMIVEVTIRMMFPTIKQEMKNCIVNSNNLTAKKKLKKTTAIKNHYF